MWTFNASKWTKWTETLNVNLNTKCEINYIKSELKYKLSEYSYLSINNLIKSESKIVKVDLITKLIWSKKLSGLNSCKFGLNCTDLNKIFQISNKNHTKQKRIIKLKFLLFLISKQNWIQFKKQFYFSKI